MTMKCRDPQKLTNEQTVEAIHIIDGIGDITEKVAPEISKNLSALRKRLKLLINNIDGRGHDGSSLIA